ncbi:unnamed protein product [Brachionus calyciflorus]|uniref:Uncharacterized protein n=1 Tax=Brachionus calyciflorus TaxID=104777 RepID=A0A813M9G6_9BILA|nr:unnamed protein product [Brachionus calyciflorus]
MEKSLDHEHTVDSKLGIKTSMSNLSNLSLNLINGSQIDTSLNTNQLSLNEKVAQLANSIYTELEKIIKLYGRDIVKDLMSIVVNILEALDAAYHEKEELLVENELLRDDNDKLLIQYEREKQTRNDTQLKLYQSEDSFAEQKREYEEKVKSLESIVRMIDLKSKNTSDHILRLEEKENEIRREYNKLHERYTELFKTHCDYLDRHKILFGQESNNNNPNNSHNNSIHQKSNNSQKSKLNSSINSDISEGLNLHSPNSKNKLFDLLKSNDKIINKTDLIHCLKSLSKNEINSAVHLFLNQEISNSTQSIDSSTLNDQSIQSACSVQSLNQPLINESIPDNKYILNASNSASALTTYMECLENVLTPDGADLASVHAKINLQSSDNFDEHLQQAEFDDGCSDILSQSNVKNLDSSEFEGDDDQNAKNDLSLYNEMSRDNYDITELDDGADLTVKKSLFGMTREVANLIQENAELLQTKHALNVLKDDLIVRLDHFSSEMLILREEIKSLQTVKAALQERINELEDEQRKNKTELDAKNKKLEEDDENIPMSQRKRFTRAEMARVLMERNQFKEKLMELQEAVRWRETMRAIKQDQTEDTNTQQTTSQEAQKKKSAWSRFFSDLFGNSSQTNGSNSPNPQTTISNQANTSPTNQSKNSKTLKKQSEQVVPLNDDSVNSLSHDNQSNEKILKAYEILSPQESKTSTKVTNKKEFESVREEGRMQAYGWSLPTLKNTTQPSNLTNVPVPVYCRPLFKDETNLKLSCAANVNYTFDHECLPESINFDQLIKNSQFSSFKSLLNTDDKFYKSSTIWICNLNDNDTHISIFDANKPGDLIQQFTLKSLKIQTLLAISGVTKDDLNEKEIKPEELNTTEPPAATIQVNKNEVDDNLDNITYIEVENDLNYSSASIQTIEKDVQTTQSEPVLSTIYPTIWLGSQEGLLLVHSTISSVNQTIDKVKLKDAILCMSQQNGKVLVGMADGSIAIFQRNLKTYEWDLKNFYVINFDNAHHSIRCMQSVYQTVWSGCRNKIYIFNSQNLTISNVIEVHPRKENQVRHMCCINDGVWVSIRLDSTLRLYHAKTHQHLQYLDIEPFITRMLGTSNLGLSIVRVTSMMTANKRLWIGTGNGVVLSVPFSQSNGLIPQCNLTDSQFSFHGHRDAVKFFLSVPSEAIQKNINSEKSSKTYEKTETMLLLSGGHGYIDFRIGDTTTTSSFDKNDIKKLEDNNFSFGPVAKNDRSHLIVWQINEH